MIAAYSAPAQGFMSLEPVADLGEDAAVAVWKAGIRTREIQVARGHAMLLLYDGKPRAVRLDVSTREEARRAAIRELGGAEVVLLEAAFRGRVTVFRRTEILRAMTAGEASKDEAVQLVSPDGYLVQKSLAPADPADAKLISDRLAGQLRYEERLLIGDKLRNYVKGLDVNWPELSPSQLSAQMSGLRTKIRGMLGAGANQMMPTWKSKTEFTLRGVVGATKRTLRDNFLPQISLSLSQADTRAIGAISTQQGFFMRDAAGHRSDQITAAGRRVVSDGLKQGLGRREIARNLAEKIPQAWQKYGKNYFRAVASVAVSRGRSYSEINGYVEAGIEAIEIQAVLDERTTEICRCLDGQIIETNLASAQMTNAMSNLSSPEDIMNASPFLKERVNQQTGTKEILTANNNTKIAEVVRSGMGKLDDRGQFKRFAANNQLTDHNIGPPPYHHLCRSWTIPVTTTIQVPRGQVPRAGGKTAPAPPRPIPKGGKKPGGVGPRPIQGDPQPGPKRGTLTGDPDVIERYPFTQDFVEPNELPRYYWNKKTPTQMRHPAVVQRYRYDQTVRAIRKSGKPETFKFPSNDELREGKNLLSNLKEQMKLAPDINGVVMHVQRVNHFTLQEVVLAESRQTAARRVYSLRAADNTKQFIKFNGDKKRAAYNHIRKLRAAKTQQEIAKALASLEKKGYIQITGDARKVTYGKPVRRMSAVPEPKKKPRRAAPKPRKKKPPTTPTVRRKPKPTTHEVTPTGRMKPKPKPKPKPLEPTWHGKPPTLRERTYEDYGLLPLDKHPLTEQVKKRAKAEAARIKDMLAEVDAKYRNRFSNEIRARKARALREFIKAETGPVEQFTAKSVKAATKQYDPRVIATHESFLNDSLQNTLKRKSMGIEYGKSAKDVVLKKWSDAQRAEYFNGAHEYFSQNVIEAMKKKGMPQVYTATNTTGGAFYNGFSHSIVMPAKDPRGLKRIFQHEYNHAVDRLGYGNESGTTFRDMYATSAPKMSAEGYRYVEGQWNDMYCGRIYDHGSSEVHTTFAEGLTKERGVTLGGTDRRLLKAVDTNIDHAGQWLAQAKGAYLP